MKYKILGCSVGSDGAMRRAVATGRAASGCANPGCSPEPQRGRDDTAWWIRCKDNQQRRPKASTSPPCPGSGHCCVSRAQARGLAKARGIQQDLESHGCRHIREVSVCEGWEGRAWMVPCSAHFLGPASLCLALEEEAPVAVRQPATYSCGQTLSPPPATPGSTTWLRRRARARIWTRPRR